jgi:hypothetical protein
LEAEEELRISPISYTSVATSDVALYRDGFATLVNVTLIHVQFEVIHPFLDGNGRIGRLLIAAMFEHWGLLAEPLLYLSGYLKQHQTEYYRRLPATPSPLHAPLLYAARH